MPVEVISEYQDLKEKHAIFFSKINKRYGLLSTLRLIVVILALCCFYFYFQSGRQVGLVIGITGLALFLWLLNQHQKLEKKKILTQTLIRINEDEIAFLKQERIPFADGMEFNIAGHAYAHDLDIFGDRSLFQHLNRTATYVGSRKLAGLLLSGAPPEQIKANQEAVRELSAALTWRQDFLAFAKISGDSKSVYEKLIAWSEYGETRWSKILVVFAFLSPMLLGAMALVYYFTDYVVLEKVMVALFLFNLLLANRIAKKHAREEIAADKIDEIMGQYSLLLGKIETAPFKSTRLEACKQQLEAESGTASVAIKKLSLLFKRIDHIKNMIGALVLNGFFLYHIHTLLALTNWRRAFASRIPLWLDAMAEVEMLNSIAHFAHNNPAFAFPELNNHFEIDLEHLGHPLIDSEKRVCNTVSFQKHKFIILTGSNMSGKSTFLRTLGVNMVLAAAGSPVCATAANIHPMAVWVSMGQQDSLANNESYFFAEVKRLRLLITQLERGVCFVLLDEILRGTNSDDKRSGTIGVIKKIIATGAIGAIATHDLEVCPLADSYPDILVNKCFEVDIVQNELAFDYALRDGVCKNKSATFLMRKMEIIDAG
jgi:hypothetical protein